MSKSNVMIFGMTGKANAGKDLSAKLIEKLLKGDKVESLAFAKPLKDAAQILFNFTDDQLHGRTEKEEIDSRWGKSPRQILQWLGSDVLRKCIDEDIFIINMSQKIKSSKSDVIVITDVRFLNELELIKSMGGKIIKIVRPLEETTAHNNHVTEQGIPDDLVDVVVLNDGTIESLENKIKEFLKLPK